MKQGQPLYGQLLSSLAAKLEQPPLDLQSLVNSHCEFTLLYLIPLKIKVSYYIICLVVSLKLHDINRRDSGLVVCYPMQLYPSKT